MRTIQVICLAVMATSLMACASGKELKAPCGPLKSYVETEDTCGPLKPINATPFDAILDVSE